MYATKKRQNGNLHFLQAVTAQASQSASAMVFTSCIITASKKGHSTEDAAFIAQEVPRQPFAVAAQDLK
jgi:hypothetical protein